MVQGDQVLLTQESGPYVVNELATARNGHTIDREYHSSGGALDLRIDWNGWFAFEISRFLLIEAS